MTQQEIDAIRARWNGLGFTEGEGTVMALCDALEETEARAGKVEAIIPPDTLNWLIQHIAPGRQKYPIFAENFAEAVNVVKSEFMEWEAQAILAENSDVRRRKTLVEATHCINVLLRWIDMMHTTYQCELPPVT
ncbi:MAG: hypothetical protein LBH14_03330 [Desulfobulbaceae bacterium]|jgi:hypothetical protein|nr:hypothetical protein [Desulfobulbaceae bacterium]